MCSICGPSYSLLLIRAGCAVIVQFMHTLFVYDEEMRWGIQGYSLCLFNN